MGRAQVSGAMSSAAPSPLLPGTPYRLTHLIARGTLGEVHEVQHETFASRYALKILHASLRHRPDAVRRFEQEARLLRDVRHPSLPRALAQGTAQDGRPYFVMELLRGEDLRAVLRRRGALGVAEACRLCGQALDALHQVHVAGYVHRDLKPENLLLTESGTLKVLDFCFAKRIDAPFSSEAAALRTKSGALLGTPRYMSPEHLIGPGASGATDQYSIAAVLFELITGTPMMGAAANFELLQRIVFEPAPTLAERLGSAQDAGLEAALARALAKHPPDRFRSAERMAAELRSIADRLDASDDNATMANPIYSNETVEVDLQAIARADAAAHAPREEEATGGGDDEPTRRLERYDVLQEQPHAPRLGEPARWVRPPKPRAVDHPATPRVDVRLAADPPSASVAPQSLETPRPLAARWSCLPWAVPALALIGSFATTLAVGVRVTHRGEGVAVAMGAARDRIAAITDSMPAQPAASASTSNPAALPSVAPVSRSATPGMVASPSAGPSAVNGHDATFAGRRP